MSCGFDDQDYEDLEAIISVLRADNERLRGLVREAEEVLQPVEWRDTKYTIKVRELRSRMRAALEASR